MQRWLLAGLVTSALLMPGRAPAQTAGTDEAAVRATIGRYLEAHATGSGAPLETAFHPSLFLMYVRDGQFMTRSAADYIASFRGAPAPDEAQRKRSIEMVDVSGTAAVAKVVLDYPTVRYTDYFTLLKIGEEWKVVNKTFHAQPKAPS